MYAISEYVMIRMRMMIINFQMNGFHVIHCTFSLSNECQLTNCDLCAMRYPKLIRIYLMNQYPTWLTLSLRTLTLHAIMHLSISLREIVNNLKYAVKKKFEIE